MQHKEEIAVIGGGLGGCLTALMLAKDPNYHVTLIESQPTLLNGASAIASRLHLGGEYPLDPVTAKDCLVGAIFWKLLMPNHALDNTQENIFTPTPPMKFFVGKKTEAEGKKNPDGEKSLTLEKYLNSYEAIRNTYEGIFEKVKRVMGWDERTTEKALFGSYEKGEFYKILNEGDYKDYEHHVAGGFQSQEQGLNVPKYLSMIDNEIRREVEAGNITLLTNHKVKDDGIEAKQDEFVVHCETNTDLPESARKKIEIKVSQVVQAAWQGGPAITKLGNSEHGLKGVTVSKRAMLLVDLPKGFTTPPAFTMLGDDGGMLAPYNDKTAICYLPADIINNEDGDITYSKPAGSIKDVLLTDIHEGFDTKPTLPGDWNDWSKPIKMLHAFIDNRRNIIDEADKPWWRQYAKPEDKWRDVYFELLKQRFPSLKNATNPRLIVRDTLNFQKDISLRRHEAVAEAPYVASMSLEQLPIMAMQPRMEMTMSADRRAVTEENKEKKGLFVLYPTKATYTVQGALQAALMVKERSERRKDPTHPLRNELVKPDPNLLETFLNTIQEAKRAKVNKLQETEGAEKAKDNPLNQFSLGDMQLPEEKAYERFLAEHPPLCNDMGRSSWQEHDKSSWVQRSFSFNNNTKARSPNG